MATSKKAAEDKVVKDRQINHLTNEIAQEKRRIEQSKGNIITLEAELKKLTSSRNG